MTSVGCRSGLAQVRFMKRHRSAGRPVNVGGSMRRTLRSRFGLCAALVMLACTVSTFAASKKGEDQNARSVQGTVTDAADQAIASLLSIAAKTQGTPFANRKPEELKFEDGKVFVKASGSASGVPFSDVLRRANLHVVTGSGKSAATFGAPSKFSMHSFGAHFVEVTWQPEIARLRVSRVVTVMDAGRILNPLAGRNQIEGGVIFGIGMALFEHTTYDPQNGAPINASLADYIVAVNADAPPIEVHFLDYPDNELNPLGARGIGEIGTAGVAAAVTAAVHHATGVRVRELPVKIENLLA